MIATLFMFSLYVCSFVMSVAMLGTVGWITWLGCLDIRDWWIKRQNGASQW